MSLPRGDTLGSTANQHSLTALGTLQKSISIADSICPPRGKKKWVQYPYSLVPLYNNNDTKTMTI